MKKIYLAWLIAMSFIGVTNFADARGVGGFHGEEGFRGNMEAGRNFRPEHPTMQYRKQDITRWQHGYGHGYTYKGAHYNYYYNGKYFNYYHNGAYYNYYYRGNYYNYFNNGLYYLYFYNGLYYNNCNNVPKGYPYCP